jgi:flagellar motor switch protein FliN/FliY
MSELTPDIAPLVLEACRAGAIEAEGSLGRALGGEFSLAIGESAVYSVAAAPAGFDGPGLAILWKFGDVGMAGILPAASGLIPDWCATPDAAAEAKLATMAKELGALVSPPNFMAIEWKARHVEHLSAALTRARVASVAALATIDLKCGEKSGQLSLVWPLEAPDELLPVAAPLEAAIEPAVPTPGESSEPDKIDDLTKLPKYSRSLLKIRVPVSVQLATKKELVHEVIALAPGSIIKFDKGCDELLQMMVGEHAVAEGEAVKIGEKFGFRVTSMLLPREHFVPVKRPRRA